MKHMVCVLLSFMISISAMAESDALVKFESHNIRVTLDVPNQQAEIIDDGMVELLQGVNRFKLNVTSKIDSFTINNEIIELKPVRRRVLRGGRTDELVFYELVDSLPDTNGFGFNYDKEGTFKFYIKFTATFDDDVENVRFSNENVGREVSGTILDKGAYLSSSSYFYPQGSEAVSSFNLTAKIPENWESISDGNSVLSHIKDGQKIQAWHNPFISDGCMFMAAPYQVKTTMVDDIMIACYFFEEDTSLFDGYLEATAGYMKMYNELIGMYPYERFTVAENFFPTGYGMPGWTLLGQQVLRLPFIKYTSLGHEVLHNWWGNSVYVDYDKGNWCEAATVYGADYRYKLMRSEESARDYRKDILKQYVSYVNDGNDFPIREFTSRTSAETRTIGYNKAMMVYHMIEEEIGSDAFWQAWKDIYNKHMTEKIAWEDWIEAFEAASGKDLSHIIPQWIDRTGAPEISVADVKKNGNKISFKLIQSNEEPYLLNVPVRFSSNDTSLTETVSMTSKETAVEYEFQDDIKTIEIDPEYHLFRKLYDAEVEPIISAVLGYDDKKFVCDSDEFDAIDAFASFGENINGDPIHIEKSDILNQKDAAFSVFLLNPDELPEYLRDVVRIESDSIFVDGTAYERLSNTFVFTGDNLGSVEKYVVILTLDYESLPRIGQLVTHYGKYSYLVFGGDKNIGKGQWPAMKSPLRVELK